MTINDINIILIGIIFLAAAWHAAVAIQMRTVKGKRQAAVKLLQKAYYQELMEGAAVDNQVLADAEYVRLQSEFNLTPSTKDSKGEDSSPLPFSSEVAQ